MTPELKCHNHYSIGRSSLGCLSVLWKLGDWILYWHLSTFDFNDVFDAKGLVRDGAIGEGGEVLCYGWLLEQMPSLSRYNSLDQGLSRYRTHRDRHSTLINYLYWGVEIFKWRFKLKLATISEQLIFLLVSTPLLMYSFAQSNDTLESP